MTGDWLRVTVALGKAPDDGFPIPWLIACLGRANLVCCGQCNDRFASEAGRVVQEAKTDSATSIAAVVILVGAGW